MKLYHHTSLAHLPFILAEGALVGTPAKDGWPQDFVWATTDERGDRTTGCCRPGERMPRIRIQLYDDEFQPWLDLVAERDDWDASLVQRLTRTAKDMGQSSTDCWYAASGPVGLDQIISIEMKDWDSPWRECRMDGVTQVGDGICFTAGGKTWLAQRQMRVVQGVNRMHYLLDDLRERPDA